MKESKKSVNKSLTKKKLYFYRSLKVNYVSNFYFEIFDDKDKEWKNDIII